MSFSAAEGADSGGLRVSAAVEEQELRTVRRRRVLRVIQIAVGVVFLVFWQLASGRLIDPFFASSPLEVGAKLVTWVERGILFRNLSITMYAMLAGFVIGSLTGFVVGFLFGRYESLAAIFDPYITAFYSLPKIALAPLFIMWFGIGIESKIAMSAIIVFFLVFLNTYSGVRDVSAVHINAARIMGASELQLLRIVISPSAAAWVLAGLKVSVPYALIGAVVGEFMSANRGIGYLIAEASAQFDTAGVFAGLMVLAVVGIILSEVIKRAEKRILRWRL
jgi:NitT/TauT family transport system permease protein